MRSLIAFFTIFNAASFVVTGGGISLYCGLYCGFVFAVTAREAWQ